MAFSLPTYSAAIDSQFVRTWYEIRPEAIDNVLLATPVWAALKMKGCFKSQVGGNKIERTIRHSVGGGAVAVAKGITLPSGEVDTKTAAFWTWRYIAAPIQRNLIDDQVNNGKFRIVSYVSDRITEARDSLMQKYETDLFRAHVTDETGIEVQGLNDLIPPIATVTTGTYGGIARPATYSSGLPATGNTFWGPKYYSGNAPIEVNLRQDMTHLYNMLDMNQNEPPTLIVTTQEIFEAYEEFAVDASHIVKQGTGGLADLGFEVLKFKGKDMVWSPNVTAGVVKMINTNYVDVMYDPQMWFDMTPWKDGGPVDMDRIAHVICALNILTTQPRRHGQLYY